MLEKLLTVLEAIAKELKRYNDGQKADGRDAVDVDSGVSTPPPAKAAPAKAAPAKAAPAKAAPAAVTLSEATEVAMKYISAKGRDSFITLLKTNGVPAVDVGNGPVYKLSNVKDDSAKLAAIVKKCNAGLEQPEEDSEV
jgi:hypothetical protein